MGTSGGGWFASEVHSLEQQERQAIGSQVSRMLLNHLLGSSFFCFIFILTKVVYRSCIKEIETTVSVCSVFYGKSAPSSLASWFVL